MSDDSDESKPNYAQTWFVVYNVIILLALLVWTWIEADSKLRDVQRRVGTLEQQCK